MQGKQLPEEYHRRHEHRNFIITQEKQKKPQTLSFLP
jgi:hypothetical protein